MNVVLDDIHHGSGNRADIIYATARSAETDDIFIRATLDYILTVAKERGYKFVKKAVDKR